MRNAIAALPWVEYHTIDADRSTRLVKFGINDLQAYSEDALRQSLPSKYRNGLAVVQPPTSVSSTR